MAEDPHDFTFLPSCQQGPFPWQRILTLAFSAKGAGKSAVVAPHVTKQTEWISSSLSFLCLWVCVPVLGVREPEPSLEQDSSLSSHSWTGSDFYTAPVFRTLWAHARVPGREKIRLHSFGVCPKEKVSSQKKTYSKSHGILWHLGWGRWKTHVTLNIKSRCLSKSQSFVWIMETILPTSRN